MNDNDIVDARIFVAGHRGLAGSAILRRLRFARCRNVITKSRSELDLRNQSAVRDFFENEHPEYVFLAAAKVGGIVANNSLPAEFIYENLAIQTNVIHEAYRTGVKRLIFLGSSCIYPRDCPQPIREEFLLTGPLEATNRSYAIAKIAGVEMCWAYNRQYGTRFLALMPTNLYGPGDYYNLEHSHVIPALIRKFNEAVQRDESEVIVWGTGKQKREFLFSDDMGEACLHLMKVDDHRFGELVSGTSDPPLVNIGWGKDITISELAALIAEAVGYEGQISFNPNKPEGTPRKVLELSKMRKLGWSPSVDLREGIRLTNEAFMAERNHDTVRV